jgi:hypothetical protein
MCKNKLYFNGSGTERIKLVHNGDVNLPFVSFSKNCISNLDNVSAWTEWVPLLNMGGECDCGVCVLV